VKSRVSTCENYDLVDRRHDRPHRVDQDRAVRAVEQLINALGSPSSSIARRQRAASSPQNEVPSPTASGRRPT
jgi:hypothetical protein